MNILGLISQLIGIKTLRLTININKMINKNINSKTLRKHLPNTLFILKTIIILFFITISQNTQIQVLENTKQKIVTKHTLTCIVFHLNL